MAVKELARKFVPVSPAVLVSPAARIPGPRTVGEPE